MLDLVMIISIVLAALQIYSLLIIGRAILSWFPIRPDSPMAPVQAFLYQVTEPVLGPVRSVVPRIGMFDVSLIVVLIGIRILMGIIAPMA